MTGADPTRQRPTASYEADPSQVDRVLLLYSGGLEGEEFEGVPEEEGGEIEEAPEEEFFEEEEGTGGVGTE